ncbi:MAG: diaminopropionate ammonia-lyase [Gammaproteobacteria bacterium]|nr:diaminopropionate ammonia-lyase [Gammaproteobacteria bacterium]
MNLDSSARLLINKHADTEDRGTFNWSFSCDSGPVLYSLSHCPAYQPTTLLESRHIALQGNLKHVWIKDESNRMGLGSFKALGGIYAVARILQNEAASCLGRTITPDELLDPGIQETASRFTFVTASAGNHGISVATGAKLFGAHAIIVLSRSVPIEFADRLNQIPCSVVWHGEDYEQSVAHAIQISRDPGRILLADGSWEGYTDLPGLVMQGYSVIPEECMNHFLAKDSWPTHIFLQAGVGGLAASFSAHVRTYWPVQPTLIIVEPEAAPCLIESVRRKTLTAVEGPISVMGRLDCKQASLIAYDTLVEIADAFMVISDDESKLGRQSARDAGLETTESGAAGLAGLLIASACPDTAARLGLDSNSRCLAVVSE